jgi:hypothetical protein
MPTDPLRTKDPVEYLSTDDDEPEPGMALCLSGGSITAAVLGLAWDRIKIDALADTSLFKENFVKPIRNLAGETIDAWGIVGGILLPGTISGKIQAS